jgi:signal transduction histidine kinase
MLEQVSLMPHAVCWAAAPRLIWTMVIANAITAISYLIICLTLFYLARRTRQVLARDWIYFVIGFALFIVACGSTHFLEVVTTWVPAFWIDAGVNVLTAALSFYVAIMLIRRAGVMAFGINDYAIRLANSEREKQQLQESLVAAQRLEEWSRMSAALSHEIRGPIESIQNLQYLISTSRTISPDVAAWAAATNQEATHLLTISNSMLAFIRQEARPEPVDLGEVAASVRFLLEPLIKEKAINFCVDIRGECVIEAFASETRQVLLNLARNACEAITQTGAKVTVSMEAEKSGVEVVVKDEGPGIAADVLPKLFTFGLSTKGEQGNGMGLWVVQHIVRRHGGDVKVDSTVGEGTRFRLWWPRLLQSQRAG